MTKEFIFIMDLMGTVAFAISGSMTAVEQGMDLFGILILALTTATGGGFIRDLTIGSLPPVVFRNPIYMILSFLTAGIVFLVLKFQSLRPHSERVRLVYEKTLLITDSMGLAAFTVDGVCAGLAQPDTTTKKGIRDLLLMIMLYDTGARIQELLNLKICDIQFSKSPTVKVFGKGGKYRFIPIMPKTVEHIRKYMKLYHPGEGDYAKQTEKASVPRCPTTT